MPPLLWTMSLKVHRLKSSVFYTEFSISFSDLRPFHFNCTFVWQIIFLKKTVQYNMTVCLVLNCHLLSHWDLIITAKNYTALLITKPVNMTFERISFTSYYTKHGSHAKGNEVSVSSTKPMQVTWKGIRRLVPEDTEQIISVSSTEPMQQSRCTAMRKWTNRSLRGVVTPESLNR